MVALTTEQQIAHNTLLAMIQGHLKEALDAFARGHMLTLEQINGQIQDLTNLRNRYPKGGRNFTSCIHASLRNLANLKQARYPGA